MSLLPASEARSVKWCRRAERICGSPPPPSPKEAARPQYLLDCARRGDGAVGADQGFTAVAVPLMLVMRVAPSWPACHRGTFPAAGLRAAAGGSRTGGRGAAPRPGAGASGSPPPAGGAMALPAAVLSPSCGSASEKARVLQLHLRHLRGGSFAGHDLHRHHRLTATAGSDSSSGSAPPPRLPFPLPSPIPPLLPSIASLPPPSLPARRSQPAPASPSPPRPAPPPPRATRPARPTRLAPARGATEPVVRLFRAARGDNTVGPQPPDQHCALPRAGP